MIRSWPSDREINARALRDKMRRGEAHARRSSLYSILAVAIMLAGQHTETGEAVPLLFDLPLVLYVVWEFKNRDKWLLPTLEYWRLGLTKW